MKEDFQLGDWLVQPSLGRVSDGVRSVHVEPRTVEVLLCLAQRPGEVVPKQEILDRVWPDTTVEEVALARCISELRKVFGDDPRNPTFIETIPKRGYRLVATISDAPSAPVPRVLPRASVMVGMTLILVAAALTANRLIPRPTATTNTQIDAVAVLPLRALPGPSIDEFIVDGTTQMVIASLTQIGPRKVISFESARRYKNSRKPLSRIARDLGVDALVQGTMVRRGDRIRVNVELIEAQSARNVWAGSYERPAHDLFDLQADVALAISRAIGPALGERAGRLMPRRRVSGDAYAAYLRGLYHLSRGTSEPIIREAITHFQAAIAAEPRYADAYTGLARCHYALSGLWVAPSEAMPLARQAAVMALELDAQLALAHTLLGIAEAYEWNWEAAGRAFRRAVELNPHDPHVREEYGRYLGVMGRADEALRELEIARELDPLSLSVNRTMGIVYNQAGRYDDAILQMKHRLAMDASAGAGRFHLGTAYANKGMFAEALAQFDQILPRDGPWRIAALGYVYARMGRTAEAEAKLAELKEMRKRRWVSHYTLARIETALGHREEALKSLRAAYQHREGGLIALKVDRGFDPLRSEPEFRRLVECVFSGRTATTIHQASTTGFTGRASASSARTETRPSSHDCAP